LGREVEVLVEGVSARSAEDLTGHTRCNKVVNFPGAKDRLGELVTVKIAETNPHSLKGTMV
jgi:tRNA-2-methylthio-N6-dimethylallyladenosine synthase